MAAIKCNDGSRVSNQINCPEVFETVNELLAHQRAMHPQLFPGTPEFEASRQAPVATARKCFRCNTTENIWGGVDMPMCVTCHDAIIAERTERRSSANRKCRVCHRPMALVAGGCQCELPDYAREA